MNNICIKIYEINKIFIFVMNDICKWIIFGIIFLSNKFVLKWIIFALKLKNVFLWIIFVFLYQNEYYLYFIVLDFY